MTSQTARELELFQRDHEAWIALAAPRIAARIPDMDVEQIANTWLLMQRKTQIAVWRLLAPEQQARVTAVRPLTTPGAAGDPPA